MSLLAHGDSIGLGIVTEEEHCLERVLGAVSARRALAESRQEATAADYDAQLLALRDEMASARLEDVPPLLEQMERLQCLADQRRRESSQGSVDLRSPYFGRLVLVEAGRQREVLIGRSTYLDTHAGVRIVDWRDAPVSRLYYRYHEGDDYVETFGDREVEGEVVVRRSLSILEGTLRRITAPQGTYARLAETCHWRRLDQSSITLAGGEGSAPRPQAGPSGRLGVGNDQSGADKTLREITALIDPRQFELITRPDSGLVVIQGGAGSGKTTLGLHRLAYLAFHDRRRFRPDRLLVVVFNDALCRYVAQVLPSLGIEGVAIRTYADVANRLRRQHYPRLPKRVTQDTPPVVIRLKKHPAMLRLMDGYVADLANTLENRITQTASRCNCEPEADTLLKTWRRDPSRPLAHRLAQLGTLLEQNRNAIPADLRVAVQHELSNLVERCRDVPMAWADLLTDVKRLRAGLALHAPEAFSEAELARAIDWCTLHTSRAIDPQDQDAGRLSALAALESDREANRDPPRTEPGREDDLGDDADEYSRGIDGEELEEAAVLDREDDALLLYLHQRLRGPLLRGGKAKEALVYEHLFIDEAQDYSPVELAVLLNTVSSGRSITMAGDLAQRLMLDNGFSDWRTVLSNLGLSHVAIEPLRIAYRSTAEIIDLAHFILGPYAPNEPGTATRSGAPVELFRFSHTGEAGGFLAEQLRQLMVAEPRAAVAVIARYPEQADVYFHSLVQGEVPHVRRVAEQDFGFKPGIDVTDVRQVKGLEFDYVIAVDVNLSSYPDTEEARHLLHVAVTRAAHQLWFITTGPVSPLLPQELVTRSQ